MVTDWSVINLFKVLFFKSFKNVSFTQKTVQGILTVFTMPLLGMHLAFVSSHIKNKISGVCVCVGGVGGGAPSYALTSSSTKITQ